MQFLVPVANVTLSPGLDSSDPAVLLDASAVGLPPGEWPRTLIVGNRFSDERVSYELHVFTRTPTREVVSATYTSAEGHVLEVLND